VPLAVRPKGPWCLPPTLPGARMARPAGDTRIPGTKQEPARVGSALSYLIRTVSEGGVRKKTPPFLGRRSDYIGAIGRD
jgi:hypothetical protein